VDFGAKVTKKQKKTKTYSKKMQKIRKKALILHDV